MFFIFHILFNFFSLKYGTTRQGAGLTHVPASDKPVHVVNNVLNAGTFLYRIHSGLSQSFFTHLWPFNKSKFNLMSGRVNLVALASPIECMPYLPNVRAIQFKLGPERLTQLGNSNVLRLPVFCKLESIVCATFLSS